MTVVGTPSQAALALRTHNPDILTCIANLSNDEVFTPPELANQMLDEVERAWADSHDGASIWADPDVTFLDPFTKSGVFLREVTARLTRGLEAVIPDLAERVDHILTKQVYGIGITRLTSLLARRSLYCSKDAAGKHSIASSFDRDWGNVWFERTEHTWAGARCVYCPANRADYDRGVDLETHAYAFTHTSNVKKRLERMFGADVQFDVIIGNPPYQLGDGGAGASAMPIYQHFVESAQKMEPRLLTLVIPSRWFAGGRGLDKFRAAMLADRRIARLVDHVDSRDVFPGVDVAGGVCYFLWSRDHDGPCRITTVNRGGDSEHSVRPLLEPGLDVFVRFTAGLSILEKVVRVEGGDATSFALPKEKRFVGQVSGQKPFGLRTYFRGAPEPAAKDDVLVLQSRGRGWVPRSLITESVDKVDRWKTFTSKSSSEHAGQTDKDGRRRVLSLSGVIPPGSVVTETYVLLGDFDSEAEARNCLSYAKTRFFRFLIVLRSSGQDIPRSAYSFIPKQDFSRPWSDEELYEKYGITDDEIAFIESQIKEMVVADG